MSLSRERVEEARDIARNGGQVGPAFVAWLCDEWLEMDAQREDVTT